MSCPARRRCAELALLLAWLPLHGQAAPSEEDLFFKNISEVNEGELHFLTAAPDRPVHHHQNRITLRAESLATGWAGLEQCHRHLDAVSRLEIVYHPERIRALRIVRAENIGRAWLEGHGVQLENIGPEATICIEAETRALLPDGPGAYVLRNGPYMRRFLDGFYPMRVTMSVSLTDSGLRFAAMTPPEQPGLILTAGENEVGYDAWFEGRLNTRIRFIASDR